MEDVLEKHIRITKESGLSRADIKRLLTDAGWTAEQIQLYLDKTFARLEAGTLLRVHGVSKSFGAHRVLQNVDFDINRGEIFGIIGLSGAGKSTLLNLLVGFIKADTGDIVLSLPSETVSVFSHPESVRALVGFSTQTPSFHPKLTVLENLEHFGTLYSLTQPDLGRRCNALLDLVGLSDSKEAIAMHLSGGMQKRLDIACALLHDPRILILDEPTADLDPLLRKQMWELIKKINTKGTTIILASHFLAEIEILCDRIAILQNKTILELGTADELRGIYSRNFRIYVLTKTKEYEKLLKELQRRKQHIVSISRDGDELVVETAAPHKVLPSIAAYFDKTDELVSLHVARPSLGSVFEGVVKR